MARKVTLAQGAMLLDLARAGETGERTPFMGGRDAGRIACAWYRTARSLYEKGLIRLVREGDAERATINDAGRAWVSERANERAGL